MIIRLPNNFGSVSKLSGPRRRLYVVQKSVEGGGYAIVGYAASREEGLTMLADYNRNPWNIDWASITLDGLYQLWSEKKAPKLGKANQDSLKAAYNHCKALYGMRYNQIKAYHIQGIIDNYGRGYSTKSAIKNLWTHLDKFALEMDIITRCYSDLLTTATPATNKPHPVYIGRSFPALGSRWGTVG